MNRRTLESGKLLSSSPSQKSAPRQVVPFPRGHSGREVLHGVGADGVGVKFPIFAVNCCCLPFRYRPKGVFGKGVGNASEMRQKCVRNASKMRQNGSCFIGKRGTSKMRQKSVKIASKMRGTPLGENTFWTIPTVVI